MIIGPEKSGVPSRVVSVCSSGHKGSGIIWDDLQFYDEGTCEGFIAYGQSKTAQIYLENRVDRYMALKAKFTYRLPGGIATGLQKHFSEETKAKWAADDNVDG